MADTTTRRPPQLSHFRPRTGVHQATDGITHPSHRSAGLRRPRREKRAALTGSGPSSGACSRRALLDLGPSRPQGPAPPCRTQHSAAPGAAPGSAGPVAARLRMVVLVEDGRGGQQDNFPTALIRRNATRKGEWVPARSLYRLRLTRPRLTIGAACRGDRWKL